MLKTAILWNIITKQNILEFILNVLYSCDGKAEVSAA